jgi:hypothetical protein
MIPPLQRGDFYLILWIYHEAASHGETNTMKLLFIFCFLPVLHCPPQILQRLASPLKLQDEKKLKPKTFPAGSWQHFLQQLPFEKKQLKFLCETTLILFTPMLELLLWSMS